MLKLPHPQRSQQKGFCSRERADRSHGRAEVVAGLTAITGLAISAAAAGSLVRLGFLDATGGRRTGCQMTAAIHKVPHTQAASRPLNLDRGPKSATQVRYILVIFSEPPVRKSACARPCSPPVSTPKPWLIGNWVVSRFFCLSRFVPACS